jgi:hypothetical protein
MEAPVPLLVQFPEGAKYSAERVILLWPVAHEERPDRAHPDANCRADVVFSCEVGKSGLDKFSLGATAFSGPAPDVALK